VSRLRATDRIVLALATRLRPDAERLVDIAAVAGMSPSTARRHIADAPVHAGRLRNTFGLTLDGRRRADELTAPLREFMPMDLVAAARVLLAVQRSTTGSFVKALDGEREARR
jgi:hypothetical protein